MAKKPEGKYRYLFFGQVTPEEFKTRQDLTKSMEDYKTSIKGILADLCKENVDVSGVTQRLQSLVFNLSGQFSPSNSKPIPDCSSKEVLKKAANGLSRITDFMGKNQESLERALLGDENAQRVSLQR